MKFNFFFRSIFVFFFQGSEIRVRPKRASSLVKSSDVDDILRKIMEEKPKPPSAVPDSTAHKPETSASFNQPSVDVKHQLTNKSNSSLPFLSSSNKKEEINSNSLERTRANQIHEPKSNLVPNNGKAQTQSPVVDSSSLKSTSLADFSAFKPTPTSDSSLKSLSSSDVTTIRAQFRSETRPSTERYGVKQFLSEELASSQYTSPDPIETPVVAWLRQNHLDTVSFRKTMDKLGAKELDDLKDALEILEDQGFRNQYGISLELTPIESRKLIKAIRTTVEAQELRNFPVLQNVIIEEKIGEGHFGLFFFNF